MVDLSQYDLFNTSMKSLKAISYDKQNKHHLVLSERKAFSFDDIKKKYYMKLGSPGQEPSSADAVIQFPDGLAILEFKNGNLNNESVSSFHNKVRDSLLILCDIIDKTISFTRKEVDFVLVYNEDKNPTLKGALELQPSPSREKIINHSETKANQLLITDGLNGFQGIYFREVYTYAVEQFEDYLTGHFPA